MERRLQRVRRNLTGVVSLLVTGLWLTALLTGQGWWLPVLLVGYIVAVPLTALLFGDPEELRDKWGGQGVSLPESPRRESRDSEDSGGDDPLQTLKHRYARGELTDEEFEEKVEQLLESETTGHSTADSVEYELDRERE